VRCAQFVIGRLAVGAVHHAIAPLRLSKQLVATISFSLKAYHCKSTQGINLSRRAARSFRRAARCISSYRRWPSPIPMCKAFWRRAPTERLVSFDIFTTGVRAFE
jgi:hypothetical protein